MGLKVYGAAAVLIAALIYSFESERFSKHSGPILGSITLKNRDVEARHKDSLSFEKGYIHQDVLAYDSILTLDQSKAEVTLYTGDVISVDENSLVVIEPPAGPSSPIRVIPKKGSYKVFLKKGHTIDTGNRILAPESESTLFIAIASEKDGAKEKVTVVDQEDKIADLAPVVIQKKETEQVAPPAKEIPHKTFNENYASKSTQKSKRMPTAVDTVSQPLPESFATTPPDSRVRPETKKLISIEGGLSPVETDLGNLAWLGYLGASGWKRVKSGQSEEDWINYLGVFAKDYFNIADAKASTGNNQGLSELNLGVKYKFQKGDSADRSSFGPSIDYQSLSYEGVSSSMYGIGGFYDYPLPHLKFFPFPITLGAEVQYLPVSSGGTIGATLDLLINGKIDFTSRFYGHGGYLLIYGNNFATVIWVFGVGYSF